MLSTEVPLDAERIRDILAGARFGHKLHYLPDLDSTNTYARRIAARGAAEGEIVIAEQQTGGRGRLGRTWISPPHVNLYLSIVLRPDLEPSAAPQITLMAAVALTETLSPYAPGRCSIKWPNDVLIDGRKVAGILAESSLGSNKIEFVILGIGVNLNLGRARMPESIRDHATSLIEFTGKAVDREAVTARLIQDVERCYGILERSGFKAIASLWTARSAVCGKKVRVQMMDGVLVGTARGIDTDGALIVEDGRGMMQRIVAGDVIPLQA